MRTKKDSEISEAFHTIINRKFTIFVSSIHVVSLSINGPLDVVYVAADSTSAMCEHRRNSN